MFAQYTRIEAAAGGVACSDRAFIRAAHRKLKPEARTRAQRDQRHAWLRRLFEYREASVQLYRLTG